MFWLKGFGFNKIDHKINKSKNTKAIVQRTGSRQSTIYVSLVLLRLIKKNKKSERLKRLRSEPRICLRKTQNKKEEPFFKIFPSWKFSCNASS